jgi:glycosyltransferase involved in cell wall biosynthesis
MRVIGVFRESFAEEVAERVTAVCEKSSYSFCDFLNQDHKFLYFKGSKTALQRTLPSLRAAGSLRPVRNAIQSLVINNLYEMDFILRSGRRFCGPRPILIVTTPGVTTFGLVLRRLGLIGRVVYWSIDWFPSSKKQFGGSYPRLILSTLFQRMDKYCFEHADLVWDLTGGISSARRQRWGNSLKQRRQSIIYPVASSRAHDTNARRPPYRVIFVGRDFYFTNEGELWMIARAICALRENGLPVSLEIFTGAKTLSSQQLNFLAYIASLGAAEFIIVHPYMPYDEVSRIIASGVCGLALFSGDRISNYAFSGKVVNYLENDLPVIISEGSAISSLIQECAAGVVIKLMTDESIYEAIEQIVKNQNMYRLGVQTLLKDYLRGKEMLTELQSL